MRPLATLPLLLALLLASLSGISLASTTAITGLSSSTPDITLTHS